MRQAFLILGHKNPKQIKRLVSTLNHPNFDFFIHIDAHVPIEPFKTEFNKTDVNIHFIQNRVKGNWGDIGIVIGTINSIKEVLERDEEYTHISLLSGQDYPIKSKEYIHDFFNKNATSDFIEILPFPLKHLGYGGMERIYHYSFNFMGKRHTYLPKKYCVELSIKGKIMNSILGVLHFILPKRKIPYNLAPYYGSQWWSLTKTTLQELILFIDTHPKYISYHKYSLLPDEMFFQTILVHLADKENLVLSNNNMRFIKWDVDSSHPKNLTLEDFNEILQSTHLFARKFDENESVLNQIDNQLLK